MPYFAEFTDTFGGEPNYCWVKRAVIRAPERASMASVMKAARAQFGLTGVKGDVKADFGDERHWTPRRSCTVLMVSWCEDDSAAAHTAAGVPEITI